MSNRKNMVVNRTELKVMILRLWGTQKEFCSNYNINYKTFRHYLKGSETFTKLNRKIVGVMVENGYNPYKPFLAPLFKAEEKAAILEAL